MAKYSNSLTSHHGESRSYRADKMSSDRGFMKSFRYKSKTIFKKISNRKRRMFLKNPLFFDKI